jgi:hypothetical protein
MSTSLQLIKNKCKTHKKGKVIVVLNTHYEFKVSPFVTVYRLNTFNYNVKFQRTAQGWNNNNACFLIFLSSGCVRGILAHVQGLSGKIIYSTSSSAIPFLYPFHTFISIPPLSHIPLSPFICTSYHHSYYASFHPPTDLCQVNTDGCFDY